MIYLFDMQQAIELATAATFTGALMYSLSWIVQMAQYLKTGKGSKDSWVGFIACLLWGLFYYLHG
jgi:hypothetical protein